MGNDVVIVLVILLIIVIVIRGPKTIPEIGRMFGRGVREAREELNKHSATDDAAADEGSKPA